MLELYDMHQDQKIRKFERQSFLQLMAVNNHVSQLTSKNVPTNLPESTSKKGDSTAAANVSKSQTAISLSTEQSYKHIRIDHFVQVLLSYALINPNGCYYFKEHTNREEIINDQAKNVIGDSLQDGIVNILSDVFDSFGALPSEDDDDEKKLAEKLLNANREKLKDDSIIKSAGLANLYEKLSQLENNHGVDIASLSYILKVYSDLLNSRKDSPEFINLLLMILPTIGERFKTSTYTRSQEDRRYAAIRSVEDYLKKNITEEKMRSLRELQNKPDPSSFARIFVNDNFTQSRHKTVKDSPDDFPYIVYWILTDDNSLCQLYSRITGKNEKEDENLFQGKLSEKSILGTNSSDVNCKLFAEYSNRLKEQLAKPGGLDAVITQRVGVRI
jgi:hypothetical protein